MTAPPMLFAAVSVLVVVATGDPGDGSTRAIEQALRTALVRDATIVVRPADEDASDETLAAMGGAEHATVLGVVSWSDRQRRVTIRFLSLPGGHWTDREIRFDTADVPAERGRTVGFALASMMPDEAFGERDRRGAASTATDPAEVNANASTAGPSFPPSAVDARSPVPPRPNPLAIDAAALAVSAPGGYGGGVGGAFAARIPLAYAFGARAALGARGEAIGPAQATSRVIVGAVGVAWQPWLDVGRRWAVGPRVDALILHLDVAHLSADDAKAAHLSRFIPGLDAAVEGTFRFADHASVIGAIGTEVVFGRTDLFVRERQVASLPPARILAELGLRVTFQ